MNRLALFLTLLLSCQLAYANHNYEDLVYRTGTQAGGELATKSGEDTTITGGNLEGDTVRMDVGNKLTLASIQDTYQSKSEGGAISTSGNVAYNRGSTNRAWVDDQSSIRGKQSVDIKAGKATHLKGAVIESKGDLALVSPEITYENLQDRDNSSGVGASFNTGLGIDPKTGKVQTAPQESVKGVGDVNFERGRKEGVSRATIGKGIIITNSNISNLNRDIAKAQQIVKDKQTHVRVVIPIVDMKQAKRDVAQIKRAVKHIGESLRREQLKSRLQNGYGLSPEQIAENIRMAMNEGKVNKQAAESFKEILSKKSDLLLAYYTDLTENKMMLHGEAADQVLQFMADMTGRDATMAAPGFAENQVFFDVSLNNDPASVMNRGERYLREARNPDLNPQVRAANYIAGVNMIARALSDQGIAGQVVASTQLPPDRMRAVDHARQAYAVLGEGGLQNASKGQVETFRRAYSNLSSEEQTYLLARESLANPKKTTMPFDGSEVHAAPELSANAQLQDILWGSQVGAAIGANPVTGEVDTRPMVERAMDLIPIPAAMTASKGKKMFKAGEALLGVVKQKIVIGENMKRVNKYAEKIGAKTYPGPPKGSSYEQGMEHNRQWLRTQKDQDVDAYDIGPDFKRRLKRSVVGKRPDSPFYNMERTETKNYTKRKQVFKRKGRFEGGVNDLDQ